MHNTKHINKRTANHAVRFYAKHQAAELEELGIIEMGEWGRSFHDGVRLATSNTASAPSHLSLLDELNNLDKAA